MSSNRKPNKSDVLLHQQKLQNTPESPEKLKPDRPSGETNPGSVQEKEEQSDAPRTTQPPTTELETVVQSTTDQPNNSDVLLDQQKLQNTQESPEELKPERPSGKTNTGSVQEKKKQLDAPRSTQPPTTELKTVVQTDQPYISDVLLDQQENFEKVEHSEETLKLNSGTVQSRIMQLWTTNRDILCSLIVVFVAGFALLSNHFLNGSSTTKLNCSYETLRAQNPEQQEDLWWNLKVGIENIVNNRTEQPGVYLFLHQGSDRASKLVKEIAMRSSRCFGQNAPMEMTVSDFVSEETINDYGYAIEKYKAIVNSGHVILIVNLNEIPAETARALHTICDTHSPIAPHVVIFLSLTTPRREGKAVEHAWDTLYELWGSKIDRDELNPLITRITDHVILLNS